MAVIEHAVLKVEPTRANDFRCAFDSARADLDAAEGSSNASLRRAVDDERTWLLTVTWERLEDHTEIFPASPGGQRFVARVGPFFAEPPLVFHLPV